MIMRYLFFYLVMAFITFSSCGNDEKKKEQTISFDALAPHNLSEETFTLQASASSGLAVLFTSSNTSIVSINGDIATLHNSGLVNITAYQSGNEEYYEASRITHPLIINKDNDPEKLSQTIVFNLGISLWKSSYGDLVLEATASSGLPITYTVSRPDLVTVKDNILTLNEGIYTENITITASQAGNAEYNAAPNISKNITVEHDTH